MKTILKEQIDKMSDAEIAEMLRRDYMRRLMRSRIIDEFLKKKYQMDFQTFEKECIIEKQNYSFEVETDAQEWELAIDGIKTIENKIQELLHGN
jgi:hypothetical protein